MAKKMKKLSLSPDADKCLKTWMQSKYWDNKNGLPSFHKFVRSLWDCHHSLIHEVNLADKIRQALKAEIGQSAGKGEEWRDIKKFAKRAQDLMNYHLDAGDK